VSSRVPGRSRVETRGPSMLSVDSSREHEEPRVSPDGTTILFGLPGVGVRHVEYVAVHPVLGRLTAPAGHRRASGAHRDDRPDGGVLPSVWRRLDVGTAAPHHLRTGRALRRGTPGGSLAQGAVRLPGTTVRAQGLHRADQRDPGPGAVDRPVASAGSPSQSARVRR
jgi:hypothetical protein